MKRLVLSLLMSVCLGLSAEAASKPNIIIFLADDMGMGDIRAYDATSKIPTPNMDRLAREGLRFTDAHTPASVCTPTRYGLLTGRYPFRSALKDDVLRSAYGAPLLKKEHETIASLLKRAGYHTGAFGKWHLGMQWVNKAGDGAAKPGVGTSQFTTTDVDFTKPITDGPLQHGFDYYFGIASSMNHDPYSMVENDRVVALPTQLRPETKLPGGVYRQGWVAPSWQDDHQDVLTSAKAREFIKQHRQRSPLQPFFMYYAAAANHFPYVPPKELNGKPVLGQGGNDDESPLRNDMVVLNDHVIGELLRQLEDPNGDGDKADSILENTLFILSSDNGADKGLYAPIRGKKAMIYEGGHRVPFIVRWPGKVPANAVSEQTIGLVDMYASLAALTGATPSKGAAQDSVNVLMAILGQAGEKPVRNQPMLQQALGGGDVFAVREGDWKLIVKAGKATELYHLGRDLKEAQNELAKEPATVARLLEVYRRLKIP